MPSGVQAFPEKWWFGSRTCEHRPLEGAMRHPPKTGTTLGLTGQGRRLRAASDRPQAISLLPFRLSGSNVGRRPPDDVRFSSQCHTRLAFRGTSRFPRSDDGDGLWPTPPWLPTQSTTWRRRIITRRRAESATGKMEGRPPLPFLPFLRERLEGPDTVRTLANRHGIPIGDGSLYAGSNPCLHLERLSRADAATCDGDGNGALTCGFSSSSIPVGSPQFSMSCRIDTGSVGARSYNHPCETLEGLEPAPVHERCEMHSSASGTIVMMVSLSCVSVIRFAS
jgi:hypothetical protein